MAFATAADELAEKTTCWGVPGLRDMADGEKVTPAGKPLTVTAIEDEKPLELLAVSEIAAEVPIWIDVFVGATERLKSGLGAGGPEPAPPPPDPQEMSSIERRKAESCRGRVCVKVENLSGGCVLPRALPMIPPWTGRIVSDQVQLVN